MALRRYDPNPMKNTKTYERKIKKLLSDTKGNGKLPDLQDDSQKVRFLLEAILLADASEKQVRSALQRLDNEFVDYNELRVCQPKEIAEVLGKDLPEARPKAESIVSALNGLYARNSQVSMAYLEDLPKRDLRRHLKELGLSPFAGALVAMTCYDVHAIPVDDSLRDVLEINEMIEEGTDLEETQGFLERVIAKKNNAEAHSALQTYVIRNAGALEKKRQADRKQREEEEKARLKAEEEARKAAAKAEAEKQAKDKAENARKKSQDTGKTKETKPASKKSSRKKATKKTSRKKSTKKTARKKASTKKTKASRSASTRKSGSQKKANKAAKKPKKSTAAKATKKKTKKKSSKKASPKKSSRSLKRK